MLGRPKGSIDAMSCETIKVMLKDELHQASGVMAAPRSRRR